MNCLLFRSTLPSWNNFFFLLSSNIEIIIMIIITETIWRHMFSIYNQQGFVCVVVILFSSSLLLLDVRLYIWNWKLFPKKRKEKKNNCDGWVGCREYVRKGQHKQWSYRYERIIFNLTFHSLTSPIDGANLFMQIQSTMINKSLIYCSYTWIESPRDFLWIIIINIHRFRRQRLVFIYRKHAHSYFLLCALFLVLSCPLPLSSSSLFPCFISRPRQNKTRTTTTTEKRKNAIQTNRAHTNSYNAANIISSYFTRIKKKNPSRVFQCHPRRLTIVSL